MTRYLWILFLVAQLDGFAQCLTSFQKISPDAYISPYEHGFGDAIAIRGNIAVVGVPESDSVQLNAGIALVYEYKNGNWSRIAALYPSEPMPNMLFGSDVQITENYIYVSSQRVYNGDPGSSYLDPWLKPGAVYIFKKPITGWSNTSEMTKVKLGNNNYQYRFEVNDQENVIGLHTRNDLYFFVRDSTEWRESITAVSHHLSARIEGLSIDRDLLAVTTWTAQEDKVYIKKALNNWTSFEELQTLEKPNVNSFGQEIIIKKDQLLVSNWLGSYAIHLYLTQDNWASIENEISLTSQRNLVSNWAFQHPENIFMNDTVIAVARRSNDVGNGVISIYKKPATGWVNNTEDKLIDLPTNKDIYTNPNFAFTPAHLMVAGGFTDYPSNNGNLLLFYLCEDASLAPIDILSCDEINSSQLNFGSNAVIHDDIIAITSLDNEREISSRREVYLFKKNESGKWQKINTLSPGIIQEEPIQFGSSIAFYNDYLVIGAPYYLENNENRQTGRVFIYKKTGDWTNVTKIAELRPSNWKEEQYEGDGRLLSFGESVLIENNTIIVGAPGKDMEVEDQGMMYVFEKPSGKEWQNSFETAKMHSRINEAHSRIGSVFAFQDNCIITPHYWAENSRNGSISVFKKPSSGWIDTVDTFVHTITTTGYRSFNQGDIVVDGDMLFIGDPTFRNSSAGIFGRIHIFKKMADNWADIEELRILNYNHSNYHNRPISLEGTYNIGFGSTFNVIDNILISGLDFAIGRNWWMSSAKKGMAPVYQALDSKWENVIELLKFEGDNSKTLDAFGLTVTSTRDDFIICAPEDNSHTGFNSGTVYAVPMPPQVKLMDPVCLDEGPINLNAYPANGVWAGNGIVDGSADIFHPDIAGVGVHEITYTTSNCYYEGRMRVTVVESAKPVFKHPMKIDLCENESILLEVDMISEAKYQWFYLPDSATNAMILGDTISSISINKPGKYWVELPKLFCAKISDTLEVKYIPNTLAIDSIPLICNPVNTVTIAVSPSGGNWNTDAADTNHVITPSLLEIGINTLIYKFEASSSCAYYDTLTVTYDPLLQDTLLIESYGICQDNPSPLYLEFFPGTKYTLQRFDTDPLNKEEITISPHKIDNEGTYQIQINKHSCSASSNLFEVSYYQDSVFIPNVVTANRDFVNDHFDIYVENALQKELFIYNRMGKLIYESDDYHNGWPNQDFPSAIYFYQCIFKTPCNPKRTTVKGWVQLLN